jgi:hypothetical protein
MSRRLAVAVLFLATLAVAPAAAGDGAMPFVQQAGSGVLAADGLTRWVAVPTSAQSSTALELVNTNGGAVQRFTDLPGSWGIPMITSSGVDGAGLSTDGKTLVLGDVAQSYPRTTSGFLVINTSSLLVRRTIQLKGDFAFDALSPDASRLYLIQHVDQNDMSKYVVRAYDLVQGRLLPGRIADRTQKGWVMAGYPMSRATSADGRWVYTLYQTGTGGFPFVHALDTIRGVAHCVGLPWRGNQNGFWNMRLTLRNGERTLAAHWLSGRPWLSIDTRTWRITHDHRAGFPWVLAAALSSVAVVLGGLTVVLFRRRRREEFEQELGDLLRVPEREVVV